MSGQPSEEELRAAYEAQLKQLRVEDVVVQTLVSLINLGGRRAGLVPGAEDERDLAQLRMAVDGAMALLPLVEEALGPDAQQIRQALSQLQLVYAQEAGGAAPAPGAPPAGDPAAPPPEPEPPSAVQSGRLWVPGQ